MIGRRTLLLAGLGLAVGGCAAGDDPQPAASGEGAVVEQDQGSTTEPPTVRTGQVEFVMPGFPAMRVFTATSGDPTRARPVVVCHGVQRNAEEYRDAWVPLVEGRDAVVIAPEFTTEDHPGAARYNLGGMAAEDERRLRDPATWTFALVEPLVREVAAGLGARTDRFSMFGHSAGAQFVHRYLAFVPDAPAERAVAANAGWYTLPDPSVRFPYGLKRAPEVDAAGFVGRDLVVMLGGDDVEDENLRTDNQARDQGDTRLERGLRFYRAGRREAQRLGVPFGWGLHVVPGVRHEHGDMAAVAAPLLLAG